MLVEKAMPLIVVLAAPTKAAPFPTPAVHESTAGMCVPEAAHANVSVPADPFDDARTVLLVDGRHAEDCSCTVTVILLVCSFALRKKLLQAE